MIRPFRLINENEAFADSDDTETFHSNVCCDKSVRESIFEAHLFIEQQCHQFFTQSELIEPVTPQAAQLDIHF